MRLIFLLPVLYLFSFPAAGQDFQAMLHVSKLSQNDTMGVNVPEYLTELLYQHIKDGTIKLYSSPSKEIVISPKELFTLEGSTKVKFNEIDKIIFYELWTIKKKTVQFKTVGFGFNVFRPHAESVSYGYVEYAEALPFLKEARIPGNANGSYYTTCEQAIRHRRFNFNVISFANQKVMSLEGSKQVKLEKIGNRNVIITGDSIWRNKQLLVTIDHSRLVQAEDVINSKLLFDAVKSYLEKNDPLFIKLGGDKSPNYSPGREIFITRIDYKSIWVKDSTGIEIIPGDLVIYVDYHPLQPVAAEDFRKWDVKIGSMKLYEFLRTDKYYYYIRKINEQDIPRHKSDKFINALQNEKWSKVTIFAE